MAYFERKTLETAFVKPGTPMLSDCLERLQQDAELSPTRARDLASGLRGIGKALNRPLNEIPADPMWLQPRLGRIEPAALSLSPKSWSNTVSNARAALVHSGIVQKRDSRRSDLSPPWRALWEDVLATKSQSLAPALGRFVHFLNRLDVAPAEVCDAHTEAYRQALAINELRKNSEDAMRQAIYGWNHAVGRLEAWPKQKLTMVNNSKRYTYSLEDFPLTFQQGVATFINRMQNPDPLDAKALRAPLRPATIRHHRAQLLRFATALVLSGFQIEEMTSLDVLVDPGNARQGLTWMLKRNNGQSSPSIFNTALMLKALAKYHLQVPDAQLEEIAELARRLTPEQNRGMTPKNRTRLRQFDDANAMRKLVVLPDTLFAAANPMIKLKTALLKIEVAIAIDILLACPIRLRNLAELHLETNLKRIGDERVFLVYDSADVKNRRMIEFELPASLIKKIDRYLAIRSPIMCPAGTPWLFSQRRVARSVSTSDLSKRVSKAIRKEVGVDMNVHLFRHFAAKLWLERYPGQYEALRRILGHAELSSTLNAYAGFEAGTASQLFANIIEQKRGSQ
ncbi:MULTISPECIES: tyrosine-type recombinase/integrase [Halocynthiibacter]|uniref:Tyr recombinase domain-containing protein n=1 Tax=Halocynthiibacter halioticoli TaxID=2986804 RepID=A0AAE3J1J7_9RHOB|nr:MULTISPECIES: tyrosine-type recombinase/integrase [Halocynthiibacter]MCV6826083.1 hypothetical protein [Halocynthiibacter halioticoli]MCW4059084.1 hypothetical protein [Halocynthiibacter sp. SDUM655004]